jgi:hypothetical protein
MTLKPTDWAALVSLVISAIFLAGRDDPRAWNWLKEKWSKTVGAAFAKRRGRIRISTAPSEHCQRHINTGSWT